MTYYGFVCPISLCSHITPTPLNQSHPHFRYTPAANNYASFYDDSQQSWSIRYDTAEAATEFAKNVGIARFNTGGSELVVQDLEEGSGDLKVAEGDSVEVRYTGWLHDINSAGCIGRSFDSNVTRDKVSLCIPLSACIGFHRMWMCHSRHWSLTNCKQNGGVSIRLSGSRWERRR
jgi:hypothetical protein